MAFLLGLDGGGTQTTVALADDRGGEILRREGAAGLIDPRRPLAAAEGVVGLVREVLEEAGVRPPVGGLCAGLAGSGDATSREALREALEGSGLFERVLVCSDGEIALEGAFLGGAGILLVAGTGSVAWGRSEDGRVARCGGWGRIAGDEGSAYWLGQEALRAVLRAFDGRGGETPLRSRVLERLGLGDPTEIPGWAGRAQKGEIAALAREVTGCAAEGDEVATRLLGEAAADLAEHARAMTNRLGPWPGGVPVVLHGGLARQPAFAWAVEQWLDRTGIPFRIEPPRADPVTGALRLARPG